MHPLRSRSRNDRHSDRYPRGSTPSIIAIWPIRLVVLEIILRRQQVLSLPNRRAYDQPDPPLVSAILPAKDEEAYLAECLQSVCRQTYPNLEILVVDDRSTDRTGEIAREIAASDPRVRVFTIDNLPPDWTGKTHALEHASQFASGQWLLFLDADTLHAPRKLGHHDGIRPVSRGGPRQPASRAALRDVLGAGGAAAGGDHADAVVPAARRHMTTDRRWRSPTASTS